ncbi:MAG: HEAT repeat domain-containing protein [Gemmatimonadaceae bacterium]
MTFKRLLYMGALTLPAAFTMPATQDTTRLARVAIVAAEEAPVAERPADAWAPADPADSLYRAGQRAISNEEFRKAANIFAEIAKKYPRSEYAADASYWRGFALYRIGGEEELREALGEFESQQQRFPNARTTGDARTLAVRVRGALARMGDANSAASVQSQASKSGDCGDVEMRTAALNALMQMESQTAVPIIKEVLKKRESCSADLRKQAVFILSQHKSSETEAIMVDVIKNDPSRAVREQAVFWMGQLDSDVAAAALENVINTSTDDDLRGKAIFAISQMNGSRSRAIIRRVAESNSSSRRMREQAIFQIGQSASAENADFLRSLFGKLKGDGNEALRKQVLFSLSQMQGFGNAKWLLSVAMDRSETDEVRGHALWTAGQNGVSGADLVALYDKLTDAPLKDKLIWVLSESNDRVASDKLVQIAQKDPDREMRKKAIFWLGQKNDPRIRQILLDIIKGE